MAHLEITLRDIDGRILREYDAQQALRVGTAIRQGAIVGTVVRVEELLQDGSWTLTAIVATAKQRQDYTGPPRRTESAKSRSRITA